MARWKQSWSDEDLNELKQLAGKVSIANIAKKLDRTTGAVLAKATEQRLPIMHQREPNND